MSKSLVELLQENAPFEEFKELIESDKFVERAWPDPLKQTLTWGSCHQIDKRVPLLLIDAEAKAYKKKKLAAHFGDMLFIAIRKKWGLEIISALISAGADLKNSTHCDHGDYTSISILHYAAKHKADKATIQALIKGGANVNNADNPDKETPLHLAAWYKNKVAVQLLIKAGAKVNAKDRFGNTPLHSAVRDKPEKAKAVVQLLIEAGADVHAKDNDDYTALRYAICNRKHSADIIKLFIDAGADINDQIKHGNTLLMDAIEWGCKVDVCCLLIESGADVNATTGYGYTALHSAVTYLRKRSWKKPSADIVKFLIDAGADINAKTDNGTTPLRIAIHICIEDDAEAIMRLLIEGGAKVFGYDNGGTLLFGRIVERPFFNEDWGRLLIEAGADVNEIDAYGNTVLMWAVRMHRSVDFIRTLIEAGADVNVKTDMDNTALFIAVKDEKIDNAICRLLIEAGSDVNVCNKYAYPESILGQAKNNHPALVDLLIEHGAK